MVKKEYYKTLEDGTVLVRTYSDSNHYIIQDGTGIEYSEAIDLENMNRTYTESEKIIEEDSITKESELEDVDKLS